jgi:hypothetical protein
MGNVGTKIKPATLTQVSPEVRETAHQIAKEVTDHTNYLGSHPDRDLQYDVAYHGCLR